MKKTFLIVLTCLCLGSLNTQAGTPDSANVRKGYKKLMIRAFSDLSEGYGVSDTIIMRLVPETKDEYLLFYSASQQTSDSTRMLATGFDKYEALLKTKTKATDNMLYKKVMYLSQFANGSFAESYNSLVEKLVNDDLAWFCTFFKRENSPKLNRLQRYVGKCK